MSAGFHNCLQSGWVCDLGSWVRNPEHVYPWNHQNYQPRCKETSRASWEELFTQPPKIIHHPWIQRVPSRSDQPHSRFLDSNVSSLRLRRVHPHFSLYFLSSFLITFLIAPRPINWLRNYKQTPKWQKSCLMTSVFLSSQSCSSMLWPETHRQVMGDCYSITQSSTGQPYLDLGGPLAFSTSPSPVPISKICQHISCNRECV